MQHIVTLWERLGQPRAYFALVILMIGADLEDVARAWIARIRYVCTVDRFEAERQFKRDEITRIYRRKHAEIDLEVARARARCATW